MWSDIIIFQNFPQFVVIHTVKGFGIVNEAEADVFLGLSCFFDDLVIINNVISGSSTFLNTAWTSGSDGKVSVYSGGDLGSIPGSGSSLEKEMATHSSTLA